MNLRSLGKLHYVGIFLARASLGIPGTVVYTIAAVAYERYVEHQRIKHLSSIKSILESVKL
jgi:hypothetical protein